MVMGEKFLNVVIKVLSDMRTALIFLDYAIKELKNTC